VIEGPGGDASSCAAFNTLNSNTEAWQDGEYMHTEARLAINMQIY